MDGIASMFEDDVETVEETEEEEDADEGNERPHCVLASEEWRKRRMLTMEKKGKKCRSRRWQLGKLARTAFCRHGLCSLLSLRGDTTSVYPNAMNVSGSWIDRFNKVQSVSMLI